MAYQAQKEINRVLERDLEYEKKQSKQREKELRKEIDELKKDNERQQNLIGQVTYHRIVISNHHLLPITLELSSLCFDFS